ncbi:hypothetical protein H6P81_006996 [Aristolochia fimbriata]|uniref:Pentatricopeptide repeat-containing protein n=1 Tax=Aristolochia fimbriata TaxID=158543 RepID=A0AAV7F2B7_ARIFI|nr:hypothetical protein H6P81_006996 [Aristolochia fimbriata]
MAYLSRLCRRSIFSRHYSSILAPEATAPLTSKQKSRAALSLLKTEKNPDRIVEICRAASLTPESSLDRVAFSVAVAKLTESQHFDSVRSLLEDLKTSRVDLRNEKFICKAIILYGRATMLDHAIRSFKQMDELDIRRTVKSLNALLYACVLADKHDEVNRIFREFPKVYGITPDLETYNTVIKALCDCGSSSSVYAILDEMERKKVKPNATSYTTLLAGFYKEEKYEDVGKVLDLMKKNDIRVGLSTYNVRIQSLCKLKKSSEAKALFEGMLSRNMKPNSNTYCHLIYGFCKEGNLAEAKRLFEDMEKRGCAEDSNCHFTLIYYLVQGGDFYSALNLYKKCMEKNWIPTFTTMKGLVNGLASISKVEEAREIVGKMKEKFPNCEEMWQVVENGLPQ